MELGHKVLIATDQYHFILHHQVIEGKADAALTIPLSDALLSGYRNIESLSLDKGFYSKQNKELLSLSIPQLVMPKKGKLNAMEKEEESQKKFKKLRNLHSAVESNINQLEHNGLDKCPDKGLKNYKRYVNLGILSYNLHRLGKYYWLPEYSGKLNKQLKISQKKKKEFLWKRSAPVNRKNDKISSGIYIYGSFS